MTSLRFLVAGLAFWMVAAAVAEAKSPLKAPKGNIYLTQEEIDEIRRGSGCRNLVRQFFALQGRMAGTGISGDDFDLKILPAEELVQGRKGRYYQVFLKDATKRARFQFPGGRYVIDDFKTRFRRAVTAFVREVLGVIEGGTEYDIFVRGSSSATPMSVKRKLLPDRAYVQIGYLPKIGPEQFAGDPPKVHTVQQQYNNKDLPFLRAAFLKDALATFYPLKQPIVLQSDVAESRDAATQFAELILYVDW